MTRATLAAAVVFWAGCGGGGSGLVPDSPNQQQNVMVIDTGIDTSVSDLAGKISGKYTEICRAASGGGSDASTTDGGPVDGGPAFDAAKQAMIAAYSRTDDSCSLKTGISSKTDPLMSIEKYRDRWNAMIRSDVGENDYGAPFTYDEWDVISPAVQSELERFTYHGTSTSTTVAHENSGVRLILVERQLMSESEVESSFTCLVQSDVDQAVALLTDPDVFAAAVQQPTTIEQDFTSALVTHHVGIVNQSFGSPSRNILEQMQLSLCTAPIDLSKYFVALSAIDIARGAASGQPPVLTVAAAGNDGQAINSDADALDCVVDEPKSLSVGSYNAGNGQRNSFSNYGACVDLYAPGQAVVTMYAGGWLLPADGTSFSAPMTVRFASMNGPSPFSVTTTRQVVLSNLDSSLNLPASVFPSDFFWTPGQVYTEALVAAPTRRPAPPKISAAGFQHVMAPLRLLRGIAHGG
jgi:hypothetical protein